MCAVKLVEGAGRRGHVSAETTTEILPIVLVRGEGFSCLFHLESAIAPAPRFGFSAPKEHYDELFRQRSPHLCSEDQINKGDNREQ